MEATPYALPMRHSWWANSTPEDEKENKPHHISVSSLQRPVPGLLNPPRGCGSQRTFSSDTNMDLEVEVIVDASMRIWIVSNPVCNVAQARSCPEVLR